ncbi:DUF6401 domain-containing protein [Saccharomonospora xinjiangensis]|uniref:DUF6401 family natural product biosynthesis protein n=1 Tax=Saccharomonospora xinjiangensis TaxID=75294 RepID=UPI00106F428D|nr:DUF6401 family natural product biosynthesis protein [Saccharomonospora xinjiangensis]QBQ60250.1 hypothetical protein EYD13_09465 [Saccharomonospora xinjiangensis]
MGWLSGARQADYARRDLDVLAGRLASAGVSTTALDPARLAEMDQHAAAVRDILTSEGGTAGVVELAAYAQGVLDAAAEAGWTPESHTTASVESTTNWIVLRLLAVCALADSSPAGDVPDIDPLLFT